MGMGGRLGAIPTSCPPSLAPEDVFHVEAALVPADGEVDGKALTPRGHHLVRDDGDRPNSVIVSAPGIARRPAVDAVVSTGHLVLRDRDSF